jgi:hypothetical protein
MDEQRKYAILCLFQEFDLRHQFRSSSSLHREPHPKVSGPFRADSRTALWAVIDSTGRQFWDRMSAKKMTAMRKRVSIVQ